MVPMEEESRTLSTACCGRCWPTPWIGCRRPSIAESKLKPPAHYRDHHGVGFAGWQWGVASGPGTDCCGSTGSQLSGPATRQCTSAYSALGWHVSLLDAG